MEDLNKYLFVIKLIKFKLNYFFYSYNNFLLHHHEIVMIVIMIKLNKTLF